MPRFLSLFIAGLVAFSCSSSFSNDNGCSDPLERTDSPFGNKRLLIIGIDGCRVDSLLAADTPNLDYLATNGAASFFTQASTGQSTVSGPGWSTILTGVWANKHFVFNNNFSSANYEDYPHIFTRIRQAHPTALLSSIVNWSPINTAIINNTDFELTGLSDEQVSEQAACHILEIGPDFLFLHFDELDGAGHGGGYHPQNLDYLATISRIDGYIGHVLEAVDQRITSLGEDWLVIVTSDHGGTPGGNHGGLTPEEVRVPLFIYGQSAIQRPISRPNPFNVDIVPTALAFLGIEVDPDWGLDGRTLPALQISLEVDYNSQQNELTIRWPGIIQLQQAPSPDGPWVNLPSSYSPHSVSSEDLQRFFRLSF